MKNETENEVSEAAQPKREGLEGQGRSSAFILSQMRSYQRC